MYKDLLEYIVKSLVKNPEKVNIEEGKDGDKAILKLKVAQEDMGRVIGKQGRIIKAIREIIYAYSSKNSEKVSVSIEEDKSKVTEENK